MENENKVWAKSIKDEDKPPITLREHTDNVLRAFLQLENKLEDEKLKESIKTAIELHDLGKVNSYFQIRTLGNKKYKPFDISHNIYHSLFSALWIDKEKLKNKVGDEYLTRFILSAVAYHHWKDSFEDLLRFGGDTFERLSDWLYENNNIVHLEKNLKAEGFTDELISFDHKMLEGLKNGVSLVEYVTPLYNLYWLPKRIGIDEKKKRNWILLSGLLMRSDHFASFCETEEEDHKIEEDGISYSIIKSNIIAQIKKKNNSFNESQFWQDSVVKEYRTENTIMIAPTGSGKTEFSFLWSNGEKFFYTLPLRSAVNQIFDRAKGVFGEEKTGLIHSDADVYLMDGKDEANTMKLYDLSRQLSYPVMISTGDQFFPYALQPPGYEKIFATFYKSRLIIDEVQAYDPKAAAIIVKFIESVVRMEGKFLLITATLPSYVEEEIKSRVTLPKKLNLYDDKFSNGKYKELKKHRIQLIAISNSVNAKKTDFTIPDDILQRIITEAKKGKRVLVILNTVKQAQFVFNELKKKVEELKDKLWLLHSRFTLEDRRNKEINICGSEKESITGEFQNPKPDEENTPKILIATQVVEASLDIDADVLFTEIAPMDALVQRMGRVLRRQTEAYIHNDEVNVNILVFRQGYQSGGDYVYKNELIEKTFAILSSILEIINAADEQLSEIIKKYYDKDGFIGLKTKSGDEKQKSKKGKSRKKQTDIEEIPSDQINQTNPSLLLSEYEKYLLVSKLYLSLDKNGKYLTKFYDTLSLLDSGYMSDRKTEAQRMFREISSISIIPTDKKEKFQNQIISFFENIPKQKEKRKGLYTKFKKDILTAFVISVPNNPWKDKREYINSVECWADSNSEFNYKLKEKLKHWCREIYFADYEYDNYSGIDTNNEKQKENDAAFI